jgi:hypothetical protein
VPALPLAVAYLVSLDITLPFRARFLLSSEIMQPKIFALLGRSWTAWTASTSLNTIWMTDRHFRVHLEVLYGSSVLRLLC